MTCWRGLTYCETQRGKWFISHMVTREDWGQLDLSVHFLILSTCMGVLVLLIGHLKANYVLSEPSDKRNSALMSDLLCLRLTENRTFRRGISEIFSPNLPFDGWPFFNYYFATAKKKIPCRDSLFVIFFWRFCSFDVIIYHVYHIRSGTLNLKLCS